jgi:hypothetical protein
MSTNLGFGEKQAQRLFNESVENSEQAGKNKFLCSQTQDLEGFLFVYLFLK